MDHYLDELLLTCPRPDTLARLIFDAASKFEGRTWVSGKNGCITYKMADDLSLGIASFLKESGYAKACYLFVDNDGTTESGIVLLGALKAGMPLVNAKVYPPLAKHSFIENRRMLAFEQGVFFDAENATDYRSALKQGNNALFFNIPHTCAGDPAFYFFSRDEACGMVTRPLAHQKAVKQIYRSVNGYNLHPYIRLVYHWFNGFEAPR
jgi:hypothetical protein